MWQGDKGDNVFDFAEHWLEKYLDECLKANDEHQAQVVDITLQKYVAGELDVVFEEGEPIVYKVNTPPKDC
tara:strand:- start:61 stop:273 length:213 start_codon:yes stop_codon:yes gene_type:complete